MKRTRLTLLLLAGSAAAAQAQTSACTRAPADAGASAALRRAAAAMGIDAAAAAGRALHFHYMQTDAQPYQSDRYYPPFFDAMRVGERWYDPGARIERAEDRRLFPGQGPPSAARPVYSNGRAGFALRDTVAQALPSAFAPFLHVEWILNPWAVVQDWQTDAAAVRVAGMCRFRDDERLVLTRTSGEREERLFLDRDSGMPVKLDFVAPHYLWGQVNTEVLYSVWIRAGGGVYPSATHVLDDGETRISRTIGTIDQVAKAEAGFAQAPPELAAAPAPPSYGGPIPSADVDTVRVSANTFLLVNPAYTETVTLQRDTIFVLDATLGEQRARQDSAWIAKLFPREHPIVVVVTDLAWPHIAGVRTWVARGATIASHPAFEPFLARVVQRRWTVAPDLLERRRATAPFRFRPVLDGDAFAGGSLRIYTIDGIGSENALMAWIPEDEFLWAGDFVQTVDGPSQYAAEVSAAVHRAGLTPDRIAAQHLPLMPWSRVLAANAGR